MTHYERCLATLAGEKTDRAPIISGFVCQAEFLLHMSGVSSEEFWKEPRRHSIEAYRRAGADAIMQFVLPKRPETATEGTGGRATNFSRREEPPEARFPTPESVIEYVQQQPSAEEVRRTFNAREEYDRYVAIMREGIRDMAPMVWVPGHVCGCPPFMWYGTFGYSGYFEAMITAPEVFDRFFAMLGEQRRLQNAEVARATREHDFIPVIYCGEDICYSAGPMCSPKLLSEIYFPHLRRAFEPLKEAGIKVVWHSDGYIMPIIEELISCGVDGFQGLEEDHGMRLETLAEMTNRDGEPLILWGSVSVTSTLPHGTVEDVRADVRRCLEIGARHGRLFLAPSSSVGPEVPTENIVELHRYGIEYGLQAYARGNAVVA